MKYWDTLTCTLYTAYTYTYMYCLYPPECDISIFTPDAMNRALDELEALDIADRAIFFDPTNAVIGLATKNMGEIADIVSRWTPLINLIKNVSDTWTCITEHILLILFVLDYK